MVKRSLLFVLCAWIPMTVSGAPPMPAPHAAPQGSACSYLDAATISRITGLHITSMKDNGDSCIYVDPTAPLSGMLQMFSHALSQGFGGDSPLRLKGAPESMPEPQSGAGVIVRVPAGVGDLSTVSVHDYVQSFLDQAPPNMGCGALQDVSGLNAVSVVCLGGGIGEGGLIKNGKGVHIMYLAPRNNATDEVVGELISAAAANM